MAFSRGDGTAGSCAFLLNPGLKLLLGLSFLAITHCLVVQSCLERVKIVRISRTDAAYVGGSGEILVHTSPCVVFLRNSRKFVPGKANPFALDESVLNS